MWRVTTVSAPRSGVVTAVLSGWIDARRQTTLETDRLTQTARVIGSLAAEPVRRSERAGVFVAIRSISQMPDVTYARIVGVNGRLLAETGGGVRLGSDADLADDGRNSVWSVLNSGTLQVSAPIMSEGEPVGEITLLSETPGLKSRVLGAVLISLAGTGIALLAGLGIALRMARRISQPITELAALDMQGHLILKARGTDGDLKCILRGIAEDMPLKVAAVAAAATPAERRLALEELHYLLNDNVEVITAPPQPEV